MITREQVIDYITNIKSTIMTPQTIAACYGFESVDEMYDFAWGIARDRYRDRDNLEDFAVTYLNALADRRKHLASISQNMPDFLALLKRTHGGVPPQE